MSRTVLYDRLAGAGARFGEYAGAETALSFGDSRAEYLELRRGCGVYDLGWRALITVAGKDRTRWLIGMVSNNVRDLAPGWGVYSFVLNPQGHILGDLYVYNRGDDFRLETDAWQLPKLLPLLQKYIIMDQVELQDVSTTLGAVAVQGPKGLEVLKGAGFHAAHLESLQIEDSVWRGKGVSLVREDDGVLAYGLWAATENQAAVWDALVAAGARPVGAEAVEMLRVAAGIPRYGQDIRERDLPQETGQMRALSFTKGCYLGQEIVERIRSRGAVHRRWTGFTVENGVPAPGAKVQADGKDVGEITSVLAVPVESGDRQLALGYIRSEAGAPGTVVHAGEAQLRIEDLPFRGI